MRGRHSLWHFFEDTARSQPDKVCYVYAGKSWTWKEVELGESTSTDPCFFLLPLGKGRDEERTNAARAPDAQRKRMNLTQFSMAFAFNLHLI